MVFSMLVLNGYNKIQNIESRRGYSALAHGIFSLMIVPPESAMGINPHGVGVTVH